MFRHEYERAFDGDANWKSLPTPSGDGTFTWDAHSTYIKKPPYFDNMVDPGKPIEDLHGMRVLALCWAILSPPTTSRPLGRFRSKAPRAVT